MAYSFGISIILFILFACVSSTNSTEKPPEETCASMGEKIMFFSAGFMTASLIFSVGCFVSRYKTSPSEENEMDRDDPIGAGEPLVASAEQNIYVNDMSADFDQKSYDYCDISPDAQITDDTSQSPTSTNRLRKSYDFVNRNWAKSEVVADSDPNPYNHVTIDMEITEYDNTCFVKPRTKTKDPTYSHLTGDKSETENVDDRKNDEFGPSTSQGFKKRGSKKGKQLMKKPKSVKRSNQIGEKPEMPSRTMKKATNQENENNDCSEAYAKKINGEESITRDLGESIYSVVVKKDSIDNEEEARAFQILCEQDDNLYQLATSSDESNGKGLRAISSSGEDTSSPSVKYSPGNSGSETENGNESTVPTSPMAVNQLYEDFILSDGENILSDDDSFKHTLDLVNKRSDEDFSC